MMFKKIKRLLEIKEEQLKLEYKKLEMLERIQRDNSYTMISLRKIDIMTDKLWLELCKINKAIEDLE